MVSFILFPGIEEALLVSVLETLLETVTQPSWTECTYL